MTFVDPHAPVGMSEERARRNVEFLVDWNRESAATDRERRHGPPQSVAIVGAGLMGSAIAAATIKGGLNVVLTDSAPQALNAAPERVAEDLIDPAWRIQSGMGGVSKAEAWDAIGRLLQCTADDTRVAHCELVLESVLESPGCKQQVYARLEPRLAAGSVLASNTSTIPIGRLAATLSDETRFCGVHFFHPVRRRPLVEIIRGPKTNDPTIAQVVSYVRAIGKMPIVVNDGPGFLVNRLLVPYLNEALGLLLEGATIDLVEQAARSFGMAMGPLRMLDEIGLDTALLGGRVLWEAFPERIDPSPLLVAMYKAGRMGRKTGAGFFAYPAGTPKDAPGVFDPQVGAMINSWMRHRREFTEAMVLDRLLLPMVLEATRLLAEQRVRDPRDVELGVLFGLGFPTNRGGLLFWADSLGAERVLAMLQPLESLGERFRPTPLLVEMAHAKRRFYEWSRT